MVIAILGRLPALGIAECERVFGADAVDWFSDHTALLAVETLNVENFGGMIKAGRIVAEFPHGDWRDVSKKLVHAYEAAWHGHKQKITVGISAYGFPKVTSRDVQKTGLVLKSHLKHAPGSLRLVPNDDAALSSATSHHNKLGLSDNKVELLIVRDPSSGRVVIAESLGAQNITALAARDQGRPKRDAFVGMLPPKLALQMVNLAGGQMEDRRWRIEDGKQRVTSSDETSTQTRETTEADSRRTEDCLSEASSAGAPETDEGASRRTEAVSEDEVRATLLDPFCGTGVLLQEAMLRSYNVYGTDLSEKMIRYTRDNLNWLQDKYSLRGEWYLHEGDAMTTNWRSPIDAVACETYLGQPFSAPPSPAKLREVRGNCNHIISEFLKNLAGQIAPGTPLCLAIPAWRDATGRLTHLPLVSELDKLGYKAAVLKNTTPDQLIYYREDQVVARELLILTKK